MSKKWNSGMVDLWSVGMTEGPPSSDFGAASEDDKEQERINLTPLHAWKFAG